MSHEITANWTQINDDNIILTAHAMRMAYKRINELFGDLYAEQHPELVAAFMQSVALLEIGAYIKLAGQDLAAATRGEV